jgi:membrane fusion protein (multidrug efflux system)
MKFLKIYLLLGIVVLQSCGGGEAPQLPPPQIEVFETTGEPVPVIHEFVGTIAGRKDIAIRARVVGFLEGIHFNEGEPVEEGTLLYTIESQQYDADEAAMQSRVAEAQTMLVKAKADLNRTKPLAANNAVSQSDLDADQAAYDAAVASLDAAKANLRASRIQLGYTKVKAPVDGLIGKTKAKVGDFVGQSPNPVILNVVSLIDTILVDFFLSENQYLSLAKELEKRKERIKRGVSEEKRREKAELTLILSDGSVYEQKGLIRFVDREIDPMTGAILIQAKFYNPDELLRPGMFARIRIVSDVKEDGILVPQRCVNELQGKFSVFVVNDENLVERREIKAGLKYGSFWLVEEGLVQGEKVIYEGLQKVRAGMPVNPVVTKVENIVEKK